MDRIKLMDEAVSNLIAAGEVVNSPYNVIKELTENAIDAQATSIHIELVNAGMEMIRVMDNGIGMSFADAQLAFTRHATSKIRDEYDLYHIHSLGFRGEALPSIAAVARVDLKTSLKDSAGSHVVFVSSKLESASNYKVVNGTDIVVTELFHNTPARLKYIKNIHQENAKILGYLNKMALLYPSIDFVIMAERREMINTTNLTSQPLVLQEIYGPQIYDALFEVKGQNQDFAISGYLTLPSVTRNSRHHLHISVNGRTIEHYGLLKIINEAYAKRLMVSRFPIGIIDIVVDPQLVDVNVHPNKLEVKMSKQEMLYQLASDVVSEAIESYYFELNSANRQPLPQKIVPTSAVQLQSQKVQVYEAPCVVHKHAKQTMLQTQNALEVEETSMDTLETSLFEVHHVDDVQVLGQFSGTYLIYAYQEKLYILDQHAAQERIHYEQYKQLFSRQDRVDVEMLSPLVFSFTAYERDVIVAAKEQLSSVGIVFNYLGQKSIEVQQIPHWLKTQVAHKYIQTLFNAILASEKISTLELMDEALILLACKLSIKANQVMTPQEQSHLIKALLVCDNFDHCPHGRPTFVNYSNHDLEKLFKRVV